MSYERTVFSLNSRNKNSNFPRVVPYFSIMSYLQKFQKKFFEKNFKITLDFYLSKCYFLKDEDIYIKVTFTDT